LYVSDVLSDTRLDLSHGCLYDNLIHKFDLGLHTGVMIARVVDEDDTHDGEEVVWVLVIDRYTRLVLEGLSDSPLKKFGVEVGEEESVQGSRALLDRLNFHFI